MKFRLIYFVLFSITSIVSCSRTPMHVKIADQKMFGFATEVQKTDNLELIMFGGGMWEQINSFGLGFISHKLVEIDEAREMYIDLSDRFLNFVNSDIKVCQYASVFPFTIEQLEFIIIFEPDPRDITGPYISGVSMGPMHIPARNMINYHQKDPTTGKSEIIYIENYNKALNILKFQQCKRDMDAELQCKGTFE